MANSQIKLEIENVGGIDSDSIEVDSGVTILSGENATNRTSILKSLMAALGSDSPPIRAGTDEGKVIFDLDDETYTRSVTSTEDGHVWSGDGVVDNVELLELFSFLHEQNRVRQAVASGDNLYDLVMNPVDTDAIESRINELKKERKSISQRADKIDKYRDDISGHESEIERFDDELEDVTTELEQVEDQIAAIDEDDIEYDKIEESNELNERLNELRDKESNLHRDIEKLNGEIEDRKGRLSSLQSSDDVAVDEMNAEITTLQGEIESLEEQASRIESERRKLKPLNRFLTQITGEGNTPGEMNKVIQENTDENVREISDSGNGDGEGDEITDQLLESYDPNVQGDQYCVLCGNELTDGHYEEVLAAVNTAMSNLSSEKSDIESEIDDLRSEKSSLEGKIKQNRKKQSEIEKLSKQIDEREERLESKESDLDEVEDEITAVESELDDLESETVQEAEDKTSKLQELQRKRGELEHTITENKSAIDHHQDRIDELEDKIASIEGDVDTRMPEIESKLDELRSKVSTIEDNVVEQFNDRMDEIIERLNYNSIERVWIDKKTKRVKRGRRKEEITVFDLNVVREVDGVATSDVVSNLSESEREVTAIVFALSGYLVHDVGDIFPIMLLDSVEMIDAQRLEKLLDSISDHVDYLVVAALPEDSDVMDVGTVIEQQRLPV